GERAIGEPEAVVGAEVEPAAAVAFGTLAQDRGGRANVTRNTIEELHQIVGAAVEDGITALQAGVEAAQRLGGGAVEGRRRGLRAERVQAEIPRVFTELDVFARLLQIAVDL